MAQTRSVRVRCHELAPAIGDPAANLALVEGAVRDAMTDGVELLVLPELVTSGYALEPDEARRCALPADADAFGRWAAMLSDDAVLVLGFCESDGDALFNSAVVLSRHGTPAVYRKTHLWDTEQAIFTPGSIPPAVLDTPVGRLGTLVCYDLEFPEMPRRLALDGAELIAVPTNWPLLARPESEHPPEVIQAMAAARASGVGIACCDRSGDERGISWTEGTAIVGADGWPVGDKDERGRLDAVVELDPARHRIGPRNDIRHDRRPELY